ncbi:hypothetical protein BRADI_3g41596v3 [Brachypodium distachyon]|uniref:Uncharacterized protein n=1 Tax=Brachypodium distachyon TaxID=15368 RepID=A0A2K2D2K7_BRADI|nr:hypothetical protein BRADI_3g41596v3 [Brachypodium distachyon]
MNHRSRDQHQPRTQTEKDATAAASGVAPSTVKAQGLLLSAAGRGASATSGGDEPSGFHRGRADEQTMPRQRRSSSQRGGGGRGGERRKEGHQHLRAADPAARGRAEERTRPLALEI